MELQDLKSFKELEKMDRNLASQVETVFKLTKPIIDNIAKHFDNFTMHDTNHSIRVAKYMEQLAFGIDDEIMCEKMQNFNALELTIMILSALLHDIGMFIRDKDKEDIRNNNIKYSNSITYEGVLKIKKTDEETIKEIIRLTHAPRIREFVCYDIGPENENISHILKVNNDYPYAEDVIKICESHGKDYSYLKENLRTETTKGDYTYNSQYIAALLRIADYLDLDKQRTPILWFSLMGIKGFSKEEWETHFQIHNDKKFKSYIDNKIQIFFDGESSNPKIHRKYLRYIDGLKIEVENAVDFLNTKNAPQKYHLNLISKIDDRVKTIGFQYSDLRLNLDYTSITDLLMGQNIYGDSRLGLRELIQNSIDSCKIMNELQAKNPDLIIPVQISISYSQKNNTVKIKDSGTGMSLDIVKKHFLNVGKSYYKSNEYISQNNQYKPIGQYGIGFLACFLLSDNVVVKTKHYENNEIIQIALEKDSEYVVTKTEKTPNFYGTEISLEYDKFFKVFKSVDELKNFIAKYFCCNIPIKIRNEDKDEPYIEIKNSCSKELETYNQKRDNISTEYFDCSKFFNNVKGSFIFNFSKKQKSHIKNLFECPVYLYDSNKKIFELVQTISNGYYYLFEYSTIEKELYDKMLVGRKNIDKFIPAIKSLSKKENKSVYLLINSNDDLDVDFYNFDFDDTKEIETIINNSNLYFYKELLSYTNRKSIFIGNAKYASVYYYRFESPWFYHRHAISQNSKFNFYYKDILVNDFKGGIFCVPYRYLDFEAYGFLNYNDENIKLDVSRNEVIEGRNLVDKKITSIILKHKLETEKNNDFAELLSHMIEFESNE